MALASRRESGAAARCLAGSRPGPRNRCSSTVKGRQEHHHAAPHQLVYQGAFESPSFSSDQLTHGDSLLTQIFWYFFGGFGSLLTVAAVLCFIAWCATSLSGTRVFQLLTVSRPAIPTGNRSATPTRKRPTSRSASSCSSSSCCKLPSMRHKTFPPAVPCPPSNPCCRLMYTFSGTPRRSSTFIHTSLCHLFNSSR